MGFLDSLFGGDKPAPAPKPAKKATPAPAVASRVEAVGVNPEVVAVIAASIYAMMGTSNLAINIKRENKTWSITGRQKVMDARLFA